MEVELLLVEDNTYDAEMTIRSLKKVGLADKMFHVKDGAEALDYIFNRGSYNNPAGRKNPKLVLLDIKMPKVDGIEVLRQIKGNENTKSIPVVVMTSSKEDSDILTSYNLGVNSYVVKPVNFEGFSKAVADLGLYWLINNQPPIS